MPKSRAYLNIKALQIAVVTVGRYTYRFQPKFEYIKMIPVSKSLLRPYTTFRNTDKFAPHYYVTHPHSILTHGIFLTKLTKMK